MRILPSVTLAVALAATSLPMAVTFSASALADSPDPSVHQIYEAEAAGNYGQAQQMMDQVLKDHPRSETAHFVQSELYAKQGKTAQARSELAQAQEIDPALSKVSPRALEELKAQLGLTHAGVAPRMMAPVPAPQPSIHWGLILIVVVAVMALWALFRRRNTYQQYGGSAMTAGPGYGGGGPPGYGPAGYGAAPMGGGVGSGIAGGLASGLAVGAGVVAGEELAHHFLDGDRREGSVVPPADNGNWQQNSNGDMGGNDFGVNDSSGWDDSGGGGGGGGDDWS